MLDIQLLRKDLPAVVAGLARRGVVFDEAGFRALEDERKGLQTRTEELQAKRNAPTRLMKDLGYGKGYRYAHDEEGGYAAGESYLPDGMQAPGWYEPTDRGLEAKIREKLAFLRRRDGESGSGKP